MVTEQTPAAGSGAPYKATPGAVGTLKGVLISKAEYEAFRAWRDAHPKEEN